MIKYILMALPGPGDRFIAEAERTKMPPSLLIKSSEEDFPDWRGAALVYEAFLDAAQGKRDYDAVLVAGWERKIPRSIYDAARLGGWNIHPSLLPKYRGHNPYFHVIKDGCRETGVTVHRITDEIDGGDILLQKRVSIEDNETIGSLWEKLNRCGAAAGLEALRILSGGDIRTTPQPSGDFPLAPRVLPEDVILRPAMTVLDALRLIRACNPFYGAAYELNGVMIKIYEATRGTSDGDGLNVEFMDGCISVSVLSVENRGLVSGAEYAKTRGARNASL